MPTHVEFADNRDVEQYSGAIVAFRCMMSGCQPPTLPFIVPDYEFTNTCPAALQYALVVLARAGG